MLIVRFFYPISCKLWIKQCSKVAVKLKKLFTYEEAQYIFSILQGALARSKSPIGIVHVFMKTSTELIPDQQVMHFSRNSDVLFHDPQGKGWWAILPNSGEKEIYAFLDRLKAAFAQTIETNYAAVYTEVRNPDTGLQELVDALHTCAKESEPGRIACPGPWMTGVRGEIKVSIVVEEPIVRDVLVRSLESMNHGYFDLKVHTFEDGNALEESTWHHSAHTHVVILDDVLPKKNGIEVVHYLRKRPSARKFHIFMLTSRVSEENVIHAYRTGIDEIIHKPFNLRLFEALFTRTLERLWLS